MGARFYRYMLLEAAGAEWQSEPRCSPPTRTARRRCAVARRGKGRVLLFTSTVDRDWSDFAIRTSFLPLMQRAAAWLAGALEERETLEGRVGQTLTLHPDPRRRWPR